MITHALKRIQRAPLPALAVLLFAAILTAVLCGLQAANEQEVEDYKEIYRTTPVTLTVTNLTGTQSDGLDAPAWVANVFNGDAYLPHSLLDYVKDLKIKTSYSVDVLEIAGERVDTVGMDIVGVTAEELVGAQPILPGDARVTWLEGFDESILLTGERVCLLPEAVLPDGDMPETVKMEYSYEKWIDVNTSITIYYNLELAVVGTHCTDDITVYCPFYVVSGIYNGLEQRTRIDCVSAVLLDNSLQEEVTEHARYWFPEPNLAGEKIPWDYSTYTYYPYALRIDDSQLRSAEETMENSLLINNICTMLVFVLSAAAGFFIGFVMIRNRKREIVLMRTMGTPNSSIYGGFAFEQMLCAVLGTILGGAVFLWQPIGRLLVFVSIYFVGLTIALLIFLHTNLLSTIKEDE